MIFCQRAVSSNMSIYQHWFPHDFVYVIPTSIGLRTVLGGLGAGWGFWVCRACASHFDDVNPLDKTVISRADDMTIPEGQRGRQVLPILERQRLQKNQARLPFHWKPIGSTNMLGEEQVTSKEKVTTFPYTRYGTPFMGQALSLVTTWETWFIPRPMAIPKTILQNPEDWDLAKHYPGGFDRRTFPTLQGSSRHGA